MFEYVVGSISCLHDNERRNGYVQGDYYFEEKETHAKMHFHKTQTGVLNIMGSLGWELCSLNGYYIFKRKK